MSTEIAGGGQVTPTALRIMESGIRRVLAKVGALSGEPPPAAAETRIMQVRGQDYYVYALDPGLFEPLVELGDAVEPGTSAALIHPHDTPWREPAIAAFGRAGTVILQARPRPRRARRLPLSSSGRLHAVIRATHRIVSMMYSAPAMAHKRSNWAVRPRPRERPESARLARCPASPRRSLD
jgi:predicted deacylase